MDESNEVLLVVEDEADMRLLIRAHLRRDPRIHIAAEVGSAKPAIEMARTSHPGVVILDHSIEGEIMGLQAAPQIKKAAPEGKILLFTAFDLAKEAAAEPAVDAFLLKSDIRKLLSKVQELLGLSPVKVKTPIA